jgi:hypothetical protein
MGRQGTANGSRVGVRGARRAAGLTALSSRGAMSSRPAANTRPIPGKENFHAGIFARAASSVHRR